MLSTAELEAAVNLLEFSPKGLKGADAIQHRIRYRADVRELEYQWAEWLASEYAPDLPKSVADKIYTRAWDEGHSSGYSQVQYAYEELAEFVRDVRNA